MGNRLPTLASAVDFENGLVVVTKGNPSRGEGFQVAHFQQALNRLSNLSAFDRFLPTFTDAIDWVTARYPSASVRTIRKNAAGVVAAVSFQCELSDFFEADAPARARR